MSGPAVRIVAPAKVNVILRVLAREATGYHQIETLFLRIALADEIVIRTGGRGRSVDCRGADVGPMEENLAYRAALAMRDAGGPDAFAIEVEKHIPVGAGLGGGSADAAAVLRGLNACRPAPLPDEAILALAAGLGADVPFLATGAAMALAWGRGERMLALDPPPARRAVVLVPPFGIATSEAYRWIDAAGLPPAPPRRWQTRELSTWEGLRAAAHNDFEAAVGSRHPDIAILTGALRSAGASPALMSGSGSAVFGVFEGGLPDPAAFVRVGARAIPTLTAVDASPDPERLA